MIGIVNLTNFLRNINYHQISYPDYVSADYYYALLLKLQNFSQSMQSQFHQDKQVVLCLRQLRSTRYTLLLAQSLRKMVKSCITPVPCGIHQESLLLNIKK